MDQLVCGWETPTSPDREAFSAAHAFSSQQVEAFRATKMMRWMRRSNAKRWVPELRVISAWHSKALKSLPCPWLTQSYLRSLPHWQAFHTEYLSELHIHICFTEYPLKAAHIYMRLLLGCCKTWMSREMRRPLGWQSWDRWEAGKRLAGQMEKEAGLEPGPEGNIWDQLFFRRGRKAAWPQNRRGEEESTCTWFRVIFFKRQNQGKIGIWIRASRLDIWLPL